MPLGGGMVSISAFLQAKNARAQGDGKVVSLWPTK